MALYPDTSESVMLLTKFGSLVLRFPTEHCWDVEQPGFLFLPKVKDLLPGHLNKFNVFLLNLGARVSQGY